MNMEISILAGRLHSAAYLLEQGKIAKAQGLLLGIESELDEAKKKMSDTRKKTMVPTDSPDSNGYVEYGYGPKDMAY